MLELFVVVMAAARETMERIAAYLGWHRWHHDDETGGRLRSEAQLRNHSVLVYGGKRSCIWQ